MGPLVLPLFSGVNTGLDLDFTRNRYRVGARHTSNFLDAFGASFSRTGQELAQTAGGVYLPFATGVPAITDAGLSVWEARTNKNTNHNSSPAVTTNVSVESGAGALSLVDDTAALALIGLSGNAFRLDNSASGSVTVVLFGGITGNTNVHTSSVFWRGSGQATLRLSGTGTIRTLPAAYAREVEANVTPGTSSRPLRIEVAAGAVVYFILNQLEEGAFATPPIVTAGASATRGAVTANVSLAGLAGTSITVDYGASSTTTFARSSLSDANILPLGSASGGAWVNGPIRRVVMR